jgi:heme/copper-type cytochrome/quinol oxidase subunit 2
MNDSAICKTLNRITKLTDNRKGTMASYSAIVLLLIPVVTVLFTSVNAVHAQESAGKYMSARIEIWAEFYRLMVVAFVIGAVVMGTVAYVVWRFRESHPRNRGAIQPSGQGGVQH